MEFAADLDRVAAEHTQEKLSPAVNVPLLRVEPLLSPNKMHPKPPRLAGNGRSMPFPTASRPLSNALN